ncbi:GspH/FimT family pseudopilin [Pseudomonas sp. 2FG]|uniref:GspH/FimT family pseudopilin n=1 Tax=Pseudomonas sp. 2FG TaxID=2502191 RepID=UPI0010F55802|nr:GspH/FimT family pseudopilin [Pseudomonas sp. 2FG]
MKTMHGQTLVELMACLLIGGIMLSLALPSFSSILQRNQQTQTVNQLLGTLHYARGSAVMSRKTIGICAGDTSCDSEALWQGHLLVFDDLNRNGQLDSGEAQLRQEQLPEGYAWHWSRSSPYLLLEADGTTRALNGTFTLCRDGAPLQQIVINLTGRVRTRAPVAGARCS